MYRDVDKRTRLGRLEKVKKPIEAGVVAIHPDELKSEDYIHRHTSYLSILVHRRIIEVYKKYTKKLYYSLC